MVVHASSVNSPRPTIVPPRSRSLQNEGSTSSSIRQTGPSSSNTKSGGTSPVASSSSSNSGAAEAPKVPGLNQSADDGKFRFVATAFSCGKTYIVNDNEFENAHAQGQWCLLSLNVSNVQNEAQE